MGSWVLVLTCCTSCPWLHGGLVGKVLVSRPRDFRTDDSVRLLSCPLQ